MHVLGFPVYVYIMGILRYLLFVIINNISLVFILPWSYLNFAYSTFVQSIVRVILLIHNPFLCISGFAIVGVQRCKQLVIHTISFRIEEIY